MATTTKPRTLRQLMADRGIKSQRDLAVKAGIWENRVGLIANGWKGTEEIRAKLAEALGVKPAAILGAARVAHDEVES